jgi:hypothetical protein
LFMRGGEPTDDGGESIWRLGGPLGKECPLAPCGRTTPSRELKESIELEDVGEFPSSSGSRAWWTASIVSCDKSSTVKMVWCFWGANKNIEKERRRQREDTLNTVPILLECTSARAKEDISQLVQKRTFKNIPRFTPDTDAGM